ncbi:PhnD/SsuA/transferrin family substrate-binding protein, partial [Acinetobacter baumannii]|uniref:PhnD/SsuA/transferrin family substrate-binding protein n=1 Tax=Acinetobacter baumannii TaxID=470 RepID=UPI0037C7419E
DAGAIDSAIFNQLIEAGRIDEQKVKVIWKSEPIFQYPWAVAKDTPQKMIDRLRSIFIAIDDPQILNVFGASGFTKATNEDYDFVRQAAIKA